MQAVYDTLLRATPEGEIEAAPRHRVGVERGQDRPDPDAARRRDVLRRVERSPPRTPRRASWPSRTAPRRTRPTSRTVADATAIDDTTLEITLTVPDPALETYLTQNAGLVESATRSPRPTSRRCRSAPARTCSTPTRPSSAAPTCSTERGVLEPGRPALRQARHERLRRPDRAAQRDPGRSGERLVPLTDNDQIPQIEGAGFTARPSRARLGRAAPLPDREGTLAPALADVRVRQAINYALDREALLEALVGGYGTRRRRSSRPTPPATTRSWTRSTSTTSTRPRAHGRGRVRRRVRRDDAPRRGLPGVTSRSSPTSWPRSASP